MALDFSQRDGCLGIMNVSALKLLWGGDRSLMVALDFSQWNGRIGIMSVSALELP